MDQKEIDYGELFELGAEGEKERDPGGDAHAEPAGGEGPRNEGTAAVQASKEEPEKGPGGEAEKAVTAESNTAVTAESNTAVTAESNTAITAADAAEAEMAGKRPQSPEENGRYAAARRKAEAERDAAVTEAREKARAETRQAIDDFYKNSGLTNPYTGKPITTQAEYDDYRSRFQAEKRKAFQRKNGMTDGEYRAFVDGLPEVRRAREEAAAAQRARQELWQREARAKVEEQLREIKGLDPSIEDIGDLQKLPTYPKLYELVKNGCTLSDAFKLANFETLTRGAAAGARQAVLNAAQGKQHLGVTRSRGTGAVPVPGDVMAQYRMLNPDATDGEIRAHYARSLKNR